VTRLLLCSSAGSQAPHVMMRVIIITASSSWHVARQLASRLGPH